MLIEISLILVSILFIASCYVIWNLTTKTEMLEDWVSNFMEAVEKIQFDLKKIDYRGSFESDDETGVIFNEIKNIVKQLDNFKGEEQ